MEHQFQYRNYFGSINYSEEDKVYWGKILYITDSVTYEGQDEADLQQSFEDTVDDYIDMKLRYGKE